MEVLNCRQILKLKEGGDMRDSCIQGKESDPSKQNSINICMQGKVLPGMSGIWPSAAECVATYGGQFIHGIQLSVN